MTQDNFVPVQPIPLPIVPTPAPAPDFSGEEGEEQSQERKPGWDWIGSPSRPEARETEDGISDLFEIDSDLTDTQDLISVDIERDILDAGPEGDLSDLVEVSEEDILGDEETGQIPLDYKPDAPRRQSLPRYRRNTSRYTPPASMGGFSG